MKEFKSKYRGKTLACEPKIVFSEDTQRHKIFKFLEMVGDAAATCVNDAMQTTGTSAPILPFGLRIEQYNQKESDIMSEMERIKAIASLPPQESDRHTASYPRVTLDGRCQISATASGEASIGNSIFLSKRGAAALCKGASKPQVFEYIGTSDLAGIKVMKKGLNGRGLRTRGATALLNIDLEADMMEDHQPDDDCNDQGGDAQKTRANTHSGSLNNSASSIGRSSSKRAKAGILLDERALVYSAEPLITKEVIYCYAAQLGKEVSPTSRGLPFSDLSSSMLKGGCSSAQRDKRVKPFVKQLKRAACLFDSVKRFAGPTYYVSWVKALQA